MKASSIRMCWYVGIAIWILLIAPLYEFEGRHADRDNRYVTFWMITGPILFYMLIKGIRRFKRSLTEIRDSQPIDAANSHRGSGSD